MNWISLVFLGALVGCFTSTNSLLAQFPNQQLPNQQFPVQNPRFPVQNPQRPIVIIQQPIVPGNPQIPQQPIVIQQPVVVPFRPVGNNLGAALERHLEKQFAGQVTDIDVRVGRRGIWIEVDGKNSLVFNQIDMAVRRIPQLARTRITVIPRNLDRLVENQIRRAYNAYVSNLEAKIDLRTRRAMVSLDLSYPRYSRAIQQTINSLPELRGYQVKTDIRVKQKRR